MHEAFRTGDFGHGHGGVKRVSPGNSVGDFELVGTKADPVRAVAEAGIDFEAEFSVILARWADGRHVFWDSPRNEHETGILRRSTVPGGDLIGAQVEEAQAAALAIAEALDEDSDVDLPWQGKSFYFPKSFFLVHAIEHAVEHRTEIKFALASAGIATPDLDAWKFSEAQGYG